jgi:hypothetical protein
MTDDGSIVIRRQLGRELRTWRERAQRTLTAPHWFALYLRLEAVASDLCTFQPILVHGLEVARTAAPDAPTEDRAPRRGRFTRRPGTSSSIGTARLGAGVARRARGSCAP